MFLSPFFCCMANIKIYAKYKKLERYLAAKYLSYRLMLSLICSGLNFVRFWL